MTILLFWRLGYT